MPRPTLFDVLTLGVFWRLDRVQEESVRRDKELKLKEREIKALEALARKSNDEE